MTNAPLPQHKMPKLIVVAAFDRGDDGELFAVYGPAEEQNEDGQMPQHMRQEFEITRGPIRTASCSAFMRLRQ